MQSLTIDLKGITPDDLLPTDNSVLTDMVKEVINPTLVIEVGPFENKV